MVTGKKQDSEEWSFLYVSRQRPVLKTCHELRKRATVKEKNMKTTLEGINVREYSTKIFIKRSIIIEQNRYIHEFKKNSYNTRVSQNVKGLCKKEKEANLF
jgi:hypothetical protein